MGTLLQSSGDGEEFDGIFRIGAIVGEGGADLGYARYSH